MAVSLQYQPSLDMDSHELIYLSAFPVAYSELQERNSSVMEKN